MFADDPLLFATEPLTLDVLAAARGVAGGMTCAGVEPVRYNLEEAHRMLEERGWTLEDGVWTAVATDTRCDDGKVKRLEVTVSGPLHVLGYRVNGTGDPVTLPAVER